MGRLFKRKKPQRRYCGYDYEGMCHLLDTLCILEDDIILTDQEQDAMDVAIQALCDVQRAMVDKGRFYFD